MSDEDDGAVLVEQRLGPEVLHSPRTATRALVILYRHAEDVDGRPGEFGEWEPFALAGEGEQPGLDEPEKCGGPKIGVWWQQQTRYWFVKEGGLCCNICGGPVHVVPDVVGSDGCPACQTGIPGDICCPKCSPTLSPRIQREG